MGRVKRPRRTSISGVALFLAASVANLGVACDKREASASTSTATTAASSGDVAASAATVAAAPAAAAGGDAAAWRADLDKVCDLPAASPRSIEQHLSLSGVTGRGASPFSRTHTKCRYRAGMQDVVIEVETGSKDLASVRTALKAAAPPQTVPGFGDEACSITVPAGATPFHTLAVVEDRVTLAVSGPVPLDKLRSLATALYADMGIKL